MYTSMDLAASAALILPLIQKLGQDSTVLLLHLTEQQTHLEDREEVPTLASLVESKTGLTRYRQQRAFRNLQKHGLVECRLQGDRRVHHTKINNDRVDDTIERLKAKPQILKRIELRCAERKTQICRRKPDMERRAQFKTLMKPLEDKMAAQKERAKTLLERQPSTVREVFEYWASREVKGQKLRGWRLGSKALEANIKEVRQVLTGRHHTLPKMSKDKLKRLINDHALEALHPDYYPTNGIKAALKGLSIGEFLYKPDTNSEYMKSRAQWLLTHAPATAAESKKPDIDVAVMNVLEVLKECAEDRVYFSKPVDEYYWIYKRLLQFMQDHASQYEHVTPDFLFVGLLDALDGRYGASNWSFNALNSVKALELMEEYMLGDGGLRYNLDYQPTRAH